MYYKILIPNKVPKTAVLEADCKFPISFRNAGFGLTFFNFFLHEVTVFEIIDDCVTGGFFCVCVYFKDF